MTTHQLSESIVVNRSPEELYALVSDVTNMGQWSPVCKACWWDEGAGANVGDWFNGRNELGDRTWETHCQVVAAEPGKEFAWAVGGSWVRWGYTFRPVDGGTEVTESWEMLPGGVDLFTEMFGDDVDNQIATRAELARTGMPVTLAAIKATAEAG